MCIVFQVGAHSEALATAVMLMYYLWPSILGFAPRCAMDAFGWLYHSEDPLYSNRLGKSLAYSRILQRSCTRLSSLLKCGKWSNWTSHSCTRESRWPRQALLSWQGYSKQKFFKQRFCQQTLFCHSSPLANILLYIPAAPLKVKSKNITFTTIPQIIFPFQFCGLEKVSWKKPLSYPP